MKDRIAQEIDVFEEANQRGYDARLNGHLQDSCPYDRNTQPAAWDAWHHAWQLLNDEIQAYGGNDWETITVDGRLREARRREETP